jgi:WhiB family redox-sensing transcriptional regulator
VNTQITDQNWREWAACFGLDPEQFFPAPSGHPDRAAEAKRVCAGCPVRELCLADALANADMHGVRGGKTADERLKLRRRAHRRKATCGNRGGYVAHRKRGEQPCDPCREAHNAYLRAWEARRRDMGLRPPRARRAS